MAVATKRKSEDVASLLVASYQTVQVGPGGACDLPSQVELAAVFEGVRDLLYPGLTGRAVRTTRGAVAKRLRAVETRLARQVWLGVCHRARLGSCEEAPASAGQRHARDLTRRFLARL